MPELTKDMIADSKTAVLSETSFCPLCRSHGVRIRTFAHLESESTTLWSCSGCHCSYLDPQPSDRWLAHEYKDYYRRRANDLGSGKGDHFRFFFETHPVRNIESALEIGGGEGACAREFLKASDNARLTVIESNPECEAFYKDLEPRVELKTVSLEAWLRSSSISNEANLKVDLVLCFDVIEHLRAPTFMIRQITSQNLNAQGQVWATFPNYDSLSRKLLGRLWPQYKTEHLFYFSRASVERLCSEAGLDVLELKPAQKYLSIAYLLGVGRNFGPELTRPLFSLLSRALPRFVQNWRLRFALGEWLLIAQKKASRG